VGGPALLERSVTIALTPDCDANVYKLYFTNVDSGQSKQAN